MEEKTVEFQEEETEKYEGHADEIHVDASYTVDKEDDDSEKIPTANITLSTENSASQELNNVDVMQVIHTWCCMSYYY